MGSHTSLADSLANGTLPVKPSNFAALQQHIDDLTKEKFDLVRGLKEQHKVAATLAEENLLATKEFNRQVIACDTLQPHTIYYLHFFPLGPNKGVNGH